jgi:hypothetical protein
MLKLGKILKFLPVQTSSSSHQKITSRYLFRDHSDTAVHMYTHATMLACSLSKEVGFYPPALDVGLGCF